MSDDRQNLEIYIDGLNHGGAEHLLLSMLPSLQSHFPKLEVVTFKGSFALTSQVEKYAKVTQLSPIALFQRLWRSQAISYVGLSKSIMIASMVAALRSLLRLEAKHIVCHEHTSFHYHTNRTAKAKRAFDFLYKRMILFNLKHNLFAYIISTKARQSELKPFLGASTCVLLFPNSFPARTIQALSQCRTPAAARDPSDPSVFDMFTLSRLDAVKQLTWAIDAAHRIAQNHPSTKVSLSICGRGPEAEHLLQHSQTYIGQANLKVHFPGFVDSIETPLKRSQLFLFPSRVEGFPLSLTEAALSGIDCIATNCPHGPMDIASHFTNVHIVEPPTHENFVASVAAFYDTYRNRTVVPPASGAQSWPSIETLTESLVKFFAQSQGRTPHRRLESIVENPPGNRDDQARGIEKAPFIVNH